MGKRVFILLVLIAAAGVTLVGCGGLKVNIGVASKTEPLKEYTLEGNEAGKVLVIPIRGFLSDIPKKGGFLHDRPSIVEEVVSQFRLAEKDKEIRAVVLEINSPGGSSTASDILYHEIIKFKDRTGTRIVAAFMDVAASGGYYIALPADRIMAHPTTITGSVGVIFVVPKVGGLMDKLGLAVEVKKSGSEKDIASPFRPSTPEEHRILQEMTGKLGGKFLALVAKHRKMDRKALDDISTARIYLADEALQLKLIDSIGYLSDALSEARNLAGLPDKAKVVVYRRTKYPNDNVYNTSASWHNSEGVPLIDLGLPDIIPALHPGFYYLWQPGTAGQ
ncbi:MAG: signal peptide peptidase SppA [Syntrophorhabdaceae bacterium]